MQLGSQMANEKRQGICMGVPGAAVFHKPFFTLRQNELPELFKKVEGLNDHRLLAIVTALIVENRIDKLLETFCPRYNRLSEQREFGFSLKIRMLESLSLIPQTITDACHIVREIRNDFAHQLEKTTLADIAPKALAHLESFYRDVGSSDIPELEDIHFNRFKFASFVAIVCLDAYCVNLGKLRTKISNQDFIASLGIEVNEEREKMMQESRSNGPIFVRKNGQKWELVYDKFSEIVDSLPSGITAPDLSQFFNRH